MIQPLIKIEFEENKVTAMGKTLNGEYKLEQLTEWFGKLPHYIYHQVQKGKVTLTADIKQTTVKKAEDLVYYILILLRTVFANLKNYKNMMYSRAGQFK